MRPNLTTTTIILATLSSLVHGQQGCREAPRVRKEIRDLSDQEWNDFVSAVNTLNSNGNTYGWYARQHRSDFARTHGTPMFFPYHREFIYRFESDLRRIRPNVTLPYWDWSLDASNPGASPVWSNRYMGSSRRGRCIPTGPFANMRVDGTCVVRGFTPNRFPSTFYSTAMLGQIIRRPVRNFRTFQSAIEPFSHASVHSSIAGDMQTHLSPRDPIFYLHHAYIDKLWDDFQRQSNFNRNLVQSNLRNARIPTFGVTVQSVMGGKCVSYQLASALEGISDVASADGTIPQESYKGTWNVSFPEPPTDEWLKMNQIDVAEAREQESWLRETSQQIMQMAVEGSGLPGGPSLVRENDRLQAGNQGFSHQQHIGFFTLSMIVVIAGALL